MEQTDTQTIKNGAAIGRVDFCRLDIRWRDSVESLQDDVQRLQQGQWVEHVNRADYRGRWDVLPLRCLDRNTDAHVIQQAFALEQAGGYENLPALKQSPALSAVLKALDCPIKAARLMRLAPGAIIKPHRDLGLGAAYGEARLHLPILMSGGIDFVCNDRPVPMQAGQLWYIDADKTHSVQNRGNAARVNLVIDCRVNDWLQRKIEQGAFCGSGPGGV